MNESAKRTTEIALIPKPRAVASGCNTQLAFGSGRIHHPTRAARAGTPVRSRFCNFCRPFHGLFFFCVIAYPALKCWAVFIRLRGQQMFVTEPRAVASGI